MSDGPTRVGAGSASSTALPPRPKLPAASRKLWAVVPFTASSRLRVALSESDESKGLSPSAPPRPGVEPRSMPELGMKPPRTPSLELPVPSGPRLCVFVSWWLTPIRSEAGGTRQRGLLRLSASPRPRSRVSRTACCRSLSGHSGPGAGPSSGRCVRNPCRSQSASRSGRPPR